jgi:2-methylcitrate dehydratase PrpD
MGAYCEGFRGEGGVTTLLQGYGRYVAGSALQPLPAHVQHHAKRALLDWMGALIAGSDLPTAGLLRKAYADELVHESAQSGLCSIAGTTLKAKLRAAAFLNGTLSHLAEYDDIYRDGAYHPASPTISPAFALAEARGLGRNALLKAITAGYEVSTRIGSAVQPSHYKYFHTTGTAGVFGAAAACAALLQVNEIMASHAMATAGTFASGLQQAFRSDAMTKPMHGGHAAEVGLSAALAAAAGMTGTLDLLEGDAGFGAAMSEDANWSEALTGLGTDFNITRMTFKNHGCCGHTFPAIDGAAALQAAHGFTTDAIKAVRIAGYRASAEVCHYRHPKSAFEAKFSLTYTVAARLVLGRVREQAFNMESLNNRDIYALENKITVTIDDACTNAFPKMRSANIEIELKNGEVFTIHQATRHGDPDDPLTDDELLDKFFELTGSRIGIANSEALSQAILEGGDVLVSKLTSYWKLI